MRLCHRIALFMLAHATAQPLLANTITVDNSSSGSVAGHCTVQDAVAAANTNAAVNGCAAGSAGLDTIVFAPGITSISLTDRFYGGTNPPDFGLIVRDDLVIDGGAVPGSGVPNVTIARDTTIKLVFGIVCSSEGSCGSYSGTEPLHALTLKGLRISGGIGGGVLGKAVTVSDCVIDGNQSAVPGAGIEADDLTISDSTVSNNTQAGGISTNMLTMTNTTVSNNTGGTGSIFMDRGSISNSTISGNSTSGAGATAGIYVYSWIHASFVTITANFLTGGGASDEVGLFFRTPDSTGLNSLSHTVVAGNLNGNDVGAAYATVGKIGGDHSWIGAIASNTQSSIASGLLIPACATLNLDSLANNGGGKRTHALAAGSCLINSGATCSATALTNDERGSGFGRCVGGALDIGAFENQTVAPTWLITTVVNPAAGGTLVCTPNPVNDGSTATCSIVPAAGYSISTVGGCGGSPGSSPTYTTGAVGAACTVTATLVATPIAGVCGSDNGQTLLAAPVNLCSAGSANAVAGSGHPWSWTCAGSNGGSNAGCAATIKTWTVSAAVTGAGGSVAPASQSVDNAAKASVIATAAAGYSISTASGCGSGLLSGNTYTTAAVGSDCSISIAFTAAPKAIVALRSSANPVVAGQSITLTATVTGNIAVPTGIVNFFDGATLLGSAPTATPLRGGMAPSAVLDSSGIATLTTNQLGAGAHSFSANYLGDGTYPAALSNALAESINPASPAPSAVAAPALSIGALILFAGMLVALSASKRAGNRRFGADT